MSEPVHWRCGCSSEHKAQHRPARREAIMPPSAGVAEPLTIPRPPRASKGECWSKCATVLKARVLIARQSVQEPAACNGTVCAKAECRPKAVNDATELRRGQTPEGAVRINERPVTSRRTIPQLQEPVPPGTSPGISACRLHHDAVRLGQDAVPPPRAGGWPQPGLRPGEIECTGSEANHRRLCRCDAGDG